MPRSFELVLIVLVLPALVLPMALTAGIVWLALGRPLMFRQHRSGRQGEVFSILKFRSMTDARDATGALLPDTARQTKATALLRRLRLDELPQLFAILDGKMALVGPRPLTPETVKALGLHGAWRGQIRPGLTGWAQISGNTALTLEQKVTLDLWYVDHRSTALDLYILLQTLAVVLFGERLRTDRIRRAKHWIETKNAPALGKMAL